MKSNNPSLLLRRFYNSIVSSSSPEPPQPEPPIWCKLFVLFCAVVLIIMIFLDNI